MYFHIQSRKRLPGHMIAHHIAAPSEGARMAAIKVLVCIIQPNKAVAAPRI